MRLRRSTPALAGLVTAAALLPGCAVFGIFSVMQQSAEYQKLVEVPAQYPGLEDQTVAVIVQADMSIMFEHPALVDTVMSGVAGRISRDVPGAKVLSPIAVVGWQNRTPQWSALPYGEWAERLDVDRVVHVEIIEYRLNPPGNSWIWEGNALADIGIVERDSFDPDSFVEVHQAIATFPVAKGLTPQDVPRGQIESGLLGAFIREIAWLFYFHEEPKYPQYYRPELKG